MLACCNHPWCVKATKRELNGTPTCQKHGGKTVKQICFVVAKTGIALVVVKGTDLSLVRAKAELEAKHYGGVAIQCSDMRIRAGDRF
jgi:hypothetical protein